MLILKIFYFFFKFGPCIKFMLASVANEKTKETTKEKD